MKASLNLVNFVLYQTNGREKTCDVLTRDRAVNTVFFQVIQRCCINNSHEKFTSRGSVEPDVKVCSCLQVAESEVAELHLDV